MKYKAIGFDYGGVINGLPGILFNRKFCDLVGVTEAEYKQAYFAHNKKVNRGEISWKRLWELVLDDLGHSDKLEAVLALQNDFFQERINTPVLELVDILRAKGYKTGLLSNDTREAATAMRKIGIDKHFDVFHVSAETGLVKPEPEAFRYLAAQLSVTLTEMVFIDDAHKSLETAEECGFMPILFESYEQLRKQLNDMGILSYGKV